MNQDSRSVCSSVLSIQSSRKSSRPVTSGLARKKSKSVVDDEFASRSSSKFDRASRLDQIQKINGIDWPCLGEKIEHWFDVAKTPDQKVVYGFLNDLKKSETKEVDSDDREEAGSRMLENKAKLSDRAQSLEDILHNLKKYRTKFSRCRATDEEDDTAPTHRSETKIATPARLTRRKDQFTSTTLDNEKMNRTMESTTWRVMRHLRSADIRNKYPLPKANPDFHFRNSTIFVAAGRPPKATFLLHPDWV